MTYCLTVVVGVGRACTTTSRRVRRSVPGTVGLRVGVELVGVPVIPGAVLAVVVGDDERVGGAGDGDGAPVMQPMVIRA